MAIINLQKIRKEYLVGTSTVAALKDVDLKIEQSGQLIVLMGPSGSGKSTLLNIMGGIDTPSSGVVEVAGQNLLNIPNNRLADFRSQKIGFIFQNFNLIQSFTAFENVMLSYEVSAAQFDFNAHERAAQLLDTVGLSEHKHKKVNQLSGGQMQRVAIARALMNDPEIILADEPTANLDVNTARNIIELLKKLATTFNKLIIIATHDSLVESYGDRKITVMDGVINVA